MLEMMKQFNKTQNNDWNSKQINCLHVIEDTSFKDMTDRFIMRVQ